MNIKKTVNSFSFILFALLFSSISAAVTVTGSGSTFEINIGEGFDGVDGADREAVFVAAARFWADILVSPVVIEVDAKFSSTLTCNSNSATLGSAGPATTSLPLIIANSIGLQSDVRYPTALINAYNGSDRFLNNADISATFNARLGDSDCLSVRNWYYGLDGNTPSNQIDFFDIVRHELGHGLGILSLANDDGTDSNSIDIFTTFLYDQSTGKNWADMTDAERNVSVTNSGNVVWTGAEVTALAGDLSAGVNSGRVQIYSPNPVKGGSSTSHFDSALTPNELMEPDYNSNSTSEHSIALLKDIGWSIFVENNMVPSNDVPVISGQSTLSTNEDTSLTLSLNNLAVSDSDNNFPADFSLTVNSGSNYSVSGQIITPNSNYVGLLSVPITVNDGTDSSSSFNLIITVNAVNDAPTISGSVTAVIGEGSSYSFTPTVSDIDTDDRQTFSISNKPSWASFSTSTGRLSGIPANSHVGIYSNIIITVTDSAGATDSLTAFSITVFNVNNSPVISGTPSTTVAEGNNYSFTPSVSDIDAGDTKAFSISNKPSWATFNTSTGTLSGTPANDDVGIYSNIVITATDSANTTSSLSAFSISVTNVNNSPVITGSPSTTVAEGNNYSFTPLVSDIDVGDTKTFSISNKPSWASFSTSTGALTGTPFNSHVGIYSNIIITVTDSAGVTDSLTAFSITVSNINNSPVISGTPSTTVAEGNNYSFTPSVSDIDVGDTKTFSISNKPSWASFSTSTGALTGTPSNSHVGIYSNIIITTTDSTGATVSLTAFNITVSNINDAPVISGSPSTTVAEGSNYSFTPLVSDIDVGDTKTFSISNKPSWATFSTSTGTLSGTPENNDVGISSNIIITTTDSAGATDSLTAFSIAVSNVNDAPVISGSSFTTVVEGNSYSFTPTVNDVDLGDTHTFSISNKPSWTSFNTSTGTLSGTPASGSIGNYSNIIISVTDSAGVIANLPAFSITVSNVNDAPVISGSPATTVAEDSSYSFTPTVNDIDTGDTETFSIVNKPSWASFSTSSGTLSGIPSNDNVDVYSNIIITVTDSAGATDSLTAFSITVSNVNDAPVISGSPSATVAEGSGYIFTPTVNDVDIGDTRAFSISNKPSWADFSSSTGTLSGTAASGSVGNYSNIIITVTDSVGSADSLTSFSITVSNVNNSPVISGSPVDTVEEGSSYSFIPTVNDVDVGDTKTFSISNKPSWTVFSTLTGELSGTPENDDVGNYSNIIITVTDSADATDNLTAFSITVLNVNDSPVISGSSVTAVVEGNNYSFTPMVSDADVGDTQTFSISNKPSWASFNASTGTLRGIPTSDSIGIYSNIIISVTDSAGAIASLTAFSITVSNVNEAPVISLPDDIETNATGLFTKVDLGTATAINSKGEQIAVSLVESVSQFLPGSYVVNWQAEDSNGLKQVASQRVDIHPLITITQDSQGIEGASYKVAVHLNGESPSYPINVPYMVSGNADDTDHNLVSGELIIESGLVGYIEFTTFQDDVIEANENIIITLENTVNLGAKSIFLFTLTENNIAPQVSLTVYQNGEQRTIIDKTLGDVVITSEVIDDNVDDKHIYTWGSVGTELIDTDDNNTSFTFNPENLATGQQIITLTVTDDANTPLSSQAFAYIDVVETLPVLTSDDQDGDSIADNIEGYGDSDGDGIADYLDNIDSCNIQPQVVDEFSQFYIETEPGYCVSKGINTLNNESGSLLLNSNEVTPDEEAVNIGGIFDFILTELPIAGDSVSLVIPQRLPIPENALYRKVNSDGVWSDFTVDENNYYSSAAGEMGFCPSPSDISWTVGLTKGHWCVQLTIEDGGSNDDDGLANHQIIDPGGVSILINANTLPIVEDDALTISQGTSVTIDVLANDTDNDGDSLRILTANVDFGSVTIVEQKLFYQPDVNFSGLATINYSVSDGNSGTGQANVLVTVIANTVTNTAPTVNDDTASTNDVTTIIIDVLVNDTDIDNDELTLTQAIAEQGSAVINNNRLIYTPLSGFQGIDTVVYNVSDNNGGESQGRVIITITASETPTTVEPTTPEESSGGGFGFFMLFMSIATLLTRKRVSK